MRTEISNLYVSLFGRAPDGEGLGFWTKSLSDGNTISKIAQSMYETAPARAYYPLFATPTEVVTTFYTNVLGRAPDAEGLAFWVKEYNASATQGAFFEKLVSNVANYNGTDAAGVTSKALFTNKVSVAQYYGEQNGTVAGATAALNGVTSVVATVDTAKAAILNNTAVTGQTFTLTTSADTSTLGSTNDFFTATHLTLNAGDVLNGGAGTDTLTIINTGTAGFSAPVAAISGIETIVSRNLNTGTTTSATAAVAQKNTIVVSGTVVVGDTTQFTYNGVQLNTAGATATTITAAGAAIAASINAYASGAVTAVNTDGTVVVTAAVAGTPFSLGGFTAKVAAGTVGAEQYATTLTTANTVAVAAVSTPDSVAATTFVGATSFINELSTAQVDYTALAAGQSVTIKGNTAVSNGTTTAAWGATVTSPVLNIEGGTTGTGAVTLTTAGATNVTINSKSVPATSTGAIGTNTIGALTTGGTSTGTVTIVADSNLSTGTAGSTINTKTVNVSGGALSVVLGALTASNLTTIDASGMTAGGLTATLTTGVTSFKGGQGIDTITTANVLTTASIDAGVGTDVLRIGAYADVDTANEAKTFINFETVDTLTLASGTLDMALFTTSTITGIRSGATTAPGYSNVTAAQAANITITGSQATSSTYGVINATQVGQIDTMNVTVNDGSATVNTITLAALTAAGVEVVNLVATDNIVLTVLTGLTGLTSSTITGAGTVNITTGALAANVNGNVNASANTGGLTWDSQSATANGFAVTGSATKANSFTGARALADVFIGGSGVDTFVNAVDANAVTTAGDIFTGGAGADTFTLRGDVASGVASTIYLTAPRITDFTVGAGGDVLILSSKLQNNTGTTGSQLTTNTAVAAGSTVIQSVAANVANAAVSTGAALIKLTTGVAESATFQTMFNAAIGTSTITVGTANQEAFFTLYDTTNSRMVIGQVEGAGGSSTTLLETADVVRLIGTVNMTAADYALFTNVNLAISAT